MNRGYIPLKIKESTSGEKGVCAVAEERMSPQTRIVRVVGFMDFPFVLGEKVTSNIKILMSRCKGKECRSFKCA